MEPELKLQPMEIPKSTLGTLLAKLALSDEALMEFSPEEEKQLGEDLPKKVDRYYYVLEKYKAEVARLAERIAEFSDTKKALQNKHDRLKALLLYHMTTKGFEKLPGVNYQLAVVTRKTVEWNLISKPDAMTARAWPTFVKKTYSWDKENLEAAIKAEPDRYNELGVVVQKPFVKFSPRKEVT